jgi:predicted nucleic acid-binding protein
MIADSTFVSDLIKERRRGTRGPTADLFNRHRAGLIRTTIITAAEIAVMFPESSLPWDWLEKWKIYQLHRGIAETAADIDRALKSAGCPLGENDTWIAGFAAYYHEPLISHDAAFDRVPGVRRIAYQRD